MLFIVDLKSTTDSKSGALTPGQALHSALDQDLRAKLGTAIRSCDWAALYSLIEEKADINRPDSDGVTPLGLAVQLAMSALATGGKHDPEGSVIDIDTIVQAYLNAPAGNSLTNLISTYPVLKPLHMVRYLLGHGADPEQITAGQSILAMVAGNHALTKLLERRVAQKHLFRAIREFDVLSIGKLLIKTMADPNLAHENGVTPLGLAVQLALEKCPDSGAVQKYLDQSELTARSRLSKPIQDQTEKCELVKDILMKKSAERGLLEAGGGLHGDFNGSFLPVEVVKILLRNKADPNGFTRGTDGKVVRVPVIAKNHSAILNLLNQDSSKISLHK